MRRLGVLLGENPSQLTARLSPPAPIPNAAPEVPVGLPSDLLRRRPDIRQAERQLAAATARIGVATADLFPRFSLSGDFGWSASRWQNLLDERSITWGLGPSVRWQLFTAGRVRNQIRAQQSRTQQSLYNYRQTVLLGLEEAENSLGSYRREQVRRSSLVAAVESSRRAVERANALYQQGLTAFQDVLDAQRQLLTNESELVRSDAAVAANLVQLYKALGGGWE